PGPRTAAEPDEELESRRRSTRAAGGGLTRSGRVAGRGGDARRIAPHFIPGATLPEWASRGTVLTGPTLSDGAAMVPAVVNEEGMRGGFTRSGRGAGGQRI